jgi:hypothetical protein
MQYAQGLARSIRRSHVCMISAFAWLLLACGDAPHSTAAASPQRPASEPSSSQVHLPGAPEHAAQPPPPVAPYVQALLSYLPGRYQSFDRSTLLVLEPGGALTLLRNGVTQGGAYTCAPTTGKLPDSGVTCDLSADYTHHQLVIPALDGDAYLDGAVWLHVYDWHGSVDRACTRSGGAIAALPPDVRSSEIANSCTCPDSRSAFWPYFGGCMDPDWRP